MAATQQPVQNDIGVWMAVGLTAALCLLVYVPEFLDALHRLGW